MPGPWPAVVLELPPPSEEELLDRLAGGILGAEVLEGAGDRTVIRIYGREDEGEGALAARVAAALREIGQGHQVSRLRVERVEDGGWVERYQLSLKPFPLGQRFVVIPSPTIGAQERGRQPIALVPGMAFGTGEHPTTRLAVEALERRVREGELWLDLGTGSGILAVVASRLGARRVVARDIDPEAVDVAREVFRANGLRVGVEISVGSSESLPELSFDGIVANIAAPYFLERAGRMAALLKDGGVLLATGFLVGEREAVEGVFLSAHLKTVGRFEDTGWSLVEAARRGD